MLRRLATCTDEEMDLSPGQLAERLVGSEGGKTAADMSKNYAVSPFCPFWGPLELLWDCTAGQHITGLTLGAARLSLGSASAAEKRSRGWRCDKPLAAETGEKAAGRSSACPSSCPGGSSPEARGPPAGVCCSLLTVFLLFLLDAGERAAAFLGTLCVGAA